MGKVIPKELCKKFKLTMHNPESVLENEMRLNFGGFRYSNGPPNIGLTTFPCDSQQKRELAELWALLLRLTTG